MGAPQQMLLASGSASGAASDFVKIAEVVTTGSQSTISFPTIPATYRHLELSVTGRGSTAATQVQLICQFNSDTGNNYDWVIWDRLNTTPGRASTSIALGLLPAASVSADIADGVRAFIPDYRGTTFQKTTASVTSEKIGTASDANVIGAQFGGGFWRSTSAISSIVISTASGNFIDGSTAVLYGKL